MPDGRSLWTRIRDWFDLVKFSHTLFALPFASVGFFLGLRDGGVFEWRILWLVLACMVLARTAAMAYNRLADRRFDAANPRTADRAIPAGRISARAAGGLVVGCSLLFVLACWGINRTVLYLSPVALAVILSYSHLKRYTSLSHLGIGLALSLAPVGAYLCVVPSPSWWVVLLGVGVLLWVSGFDILYSLQDGEFDRSQGLHSIPASVGSGRAIWIARVLTLLSLVPICWVAIGQGRTLLAVMGAGLFFGIEVMQLVAVRTTDWSAVGPRYMLRNGVASLVYGVFVSLSLAAQVVNW